VDRLHWDFPHFVGVRVLEGVEHVDRPHWDSPHFVGPVLEVQEVVQGVLELEEEEGLLQQVQPHSALGGWLVDEAFRLYGDSIEDSQFQKRVLNGILYQDVCGPLFHGHGSPALLECSHIPLDLEQSLPSPLL